MTICQHSLTERLYQSAIADNKIAIFSKSSCPYCEETKTLFAANFQDKQPKVMEYVEALHLRTAGRVTNIN